MEQVALQAPVDWWAAKAETWVGNCRVVDLTRFQQRLGHILDLYHFFPTSRQCFIGFLDQLDLRDLYLVSSPYGRKRGDGFPVAELVRALEVHRGNPNVRYASLPGYSMQVLIEVLHVSLWKYLHEEASDRGGPVEEGKAVCTSATSATYIKSQAIIRGKFEPKTLWLCGIV